MKQLVFILLMFVANICFAQNNNKDVLERLAKEIRVRNVIETEYAGCFGNSSEFIQSIDSFISLLSTKDAIKYFDDTTKSIKYYSFLSILIHLEDSTAIEKLKLILYDTSSVAVIYGGPDRTFYFPFNSFVSSRYKEYLKIKYLYGYGSIGNVVMYSSKDTRNKKTYKAKLKEYKREIESQMPNFKQ